MNNVQLSGTISNDIYYDVLVRNGSTTPYLRVILYTSGKRSSLRLHGIRVAFYGGMAKLAHAYLRPGSGLFVQGHLQSRKVEKNGLATVVFEIVAEDFTPLQNTNRENGDELYSKMMASGEIEAVPGMEIHPFHVAYTETEQDAAWS